MKRTERLAEACAPDGSVLTLYRRDDVYGIRVGAEELMSTRRYHSEEKLAELACRAHADDTEPRVLIGGLGLGFTLRAALRTLPPGAHVVVAEIVAEIIDWNRDPSYPFAADALADPRVEVRHVDVLYLLGASRCEFDAIMLDIDNGAEAMTTGGNAALYGESGVHLAARALRPGGTIAYWSAVRDPRFAALLRRSGLRVEEVEVRAHLTSGGRHTVLVGTAPRRVAE